MSARGLAALDDGCLAEGVIDLAFRDDTTEFAGWTVVDFKTDQEIAETSERYIAQVRAEASSAQNGMAAASADGSKVCVLIRRLNFSCIRSIAFVVRALRHWLGGNEVKSEQPVAGFLQRAGIPGIPVAFDLAPDSDHDVLADGGAE